MLRRSSLTASFVVTPFALLFACSAQDSNRVPTGSQASAGSTSSGGSVTTGTTGGASTASGGSSSVGGAATGGAAGTATAGAGGSAGTSSGGSGPVMKDCAQKFTVTSPAIADFESYDGTVTPDMFVFQFGSATAGMGVYAGPYSFSDTLGTSTFGILAGHASERALSDVYSVTTCPMATPTCWGTALALWFGCVDASTYSGISFWVRGSTPGGTISVSIPMEDTSAAAADPAGGGTCTGTDETCKAPIAKDIPVTADWTQVTLPWAMFTAGDANGTAVPATGNNLTGIQFSAGLVFEPDPAFVDNPDDPNDMATWYPLPGDIDVKIDDIAFVE